MLAVVLGAALTAPAAEPDITGFSEQVVYLGPAEPVSMVAGKSAKVELRFRISPTFHINSNTSKGELLIPTRILLSPPTDIMIGRITYPEGMDATFPFAPTEVLNVYFGRFNITALVTSTRKATPGTFRVHGSLKYQACDTRACYPPRQVPVDFDVTVRKPLKKR